ncbi:MAG: hypothetical protein IJP57_00860 [Firmicutes bacterium]|nr:hypothetical protein [Bacillota bacterium]
MGIDKAGHHELAAQVDQLRILRFIFQHFLVAAGAHDDTVLHADGADERLRFVHGLDDAVVEDPVHFCLLILFSGSLPPQL